MTEKVKMNVKRGRIYWMDNLRTFIIFLVVLYHVGGVYEAARVDGANAMQRFFRKEKLKLTTGMEMGSLTSIKQGVQAGLGLGLLPRGAVQVELMLGRLVELKVRGLPIPRHWYVVMHKGKRLSLAAEAFRALLIDEAVELLVD